MCDAILPNFAALKVDVEKVDKIDQIDQDRSPEDGNETSSGGVNKKQENLGKVFMFRFSYHLANKVILDPWIKEHCTRATFQGERGEEDGYLHWQMTVELKKRKRWTWFKHHFLNGVYASRIRNEDASFDYTNKLETRIEGPYQYPEPVLMPRNFFLEDHCVRFNWQAELEDILRSPVDRRVIHWYWSKQGQTGKTIFARHLLLTIPNIQYVKGFRRDVFMTLTNSTQGVIINLARGDHISANLMSMLEDLKDGLLFSSKYESKALILDPLHVIIFANEEPSDECRIVMSEDRLHVVNVGKV